MLTSPPSPSIPVAVDADTNQRPKVFWARMHLGLIVLISAEFISGASIRTSNPFFGPWTWLLTFWLYSAHFFFFTTLAFRTGRTSFWALYLWGVLYGLYEAFITKVIWAGFGDDGYASWAIGPYGYSEISMVFWFHPFASFIIPLAIVCLLMPELRSLFPGLAVLTTHGKAARFAQAWYLWSALAILSFNGVSPANLALNWTFALVLLYLFTYLSRKTRNVQAGETVVVLGRMGFRVVCTYLAVLYLATYLLLNPENLPSIPVQLLTFLWYGLACLGLWGMKSRTPAVPVPKVEAHEKRLVRLFLVLVVVLPMVGVMVKDYPVVKVPTVLNFATWGTAGFVLFGIALLKALAEWRETRSSGLHKA